MPDVKVLVVDDSSTMRRIIINSLKRLHFTQVAEAANGAEALEKLPLDVGLIITDWNMPKMTGLEFVRRVRSSEPFRNVPIIMVTSDAFKNEIVDAIRHGVSNYVLKPFTVEVLKGKIEAVLGIEIGKIG